MTKAQAEQRVAAQMPLDTKAERADIVVDNTDTEEVTRIQVEKIILDLKRSKFHWKASFFRFCLGLGPVSDGLCRLSTELKKWS